VATAGASQDEEPDAQPLLGWLVGVTAGHGAEQQLDLLRRLGARTLHGPVAESSSIGTDEELVPVNAPGEKSGPDETGRAARRLTIAVAECCLDAVTFTSPTAVEHFVELARVEGRAGDVEAALRGPVLAISLDPACTAAILDAGFPAPLEPRSPRLDAMVRRLGDHAAARRRKVAAGGVWLMLDATDPVIDGRLVQMGARERGVLETLAHRPGAVVSKVALCQSVWGRSSGLHAVEVTVGRLRDRLTAACGPLVTIETVPRRGYRLVGAGAATVSSDAARGRNAEPAVRSE
jgi:DNA-binding winged helix-turn-helix (wHTH) protein